MKVATQPTALSGTRSPALSRRSKDCPTPQWLEMALLVGVKPAAARTG